MNIQRTLTFLFALLISMAAAAHDIEVANNDGVTIYYTYINNNSELEVSYRGTSYSTYSGEYSGRVVIPSSVYYNGKTYPVTRIGNLAFEGCGGLTSINIPNSVTNIGISAFSGTAWYDNQPDGLVYAGKVAYEYKGTMPSNTSIVLKEGTLGIADYAFSGCSGLTSVNIPNSVTSIGSSAFRSCSGLTSINIPNSVTSIGNSAFYGTAWYNNQPDGLVYAGKVAYKYKGTMPSNTSIVLKDGTLGIADDAFRSCSGLTSINIPNSVTSIGSYAFNGCSGLTKIKVAEGNNKYDSRDDCNAIIETTSNTLISGCKNTVIPNSVTSIGSYAFYNCSGLTSINIPNSVTDIGSSAFSGCGSLTSISIPNSVTDIGSGAFSGCSGLTSINIPNSVTTIGELAFFNCCGLTSINIPNSVTSIGNSAFYECSGLTSINIPNSVTSIGSDAFSGCSGLTSINIPNSVTSIGSYAFRNCSGLTSIIIPNSVTTIGEYAFSDCGSLTSINIPNSVTSIGSSAFFNCRGLTSINIPNSVTSIGSSAFKGCSGLTSINIPNSVTSIGSDAFYGCSGLTTVNIPNSVITIGRQAFYKCSSLTGIDIPNSVTSIGSDAFYGCSGLTTVNIPNSVTTIGEYAFYGCRGLTSINIPNSVTSIGSDAFSGCSGLTSITIPNSVTSIGSYTFSGCSSLTNVDIPNSVTNIGNYAFAWCSGLTSINILNSVTSIGGNAFSGTAWYDNQPDGLVYAGKVAYKYKGTMPSNTSIVLKEGTLGIADDAFENCSGLTSISIPNSVTSIGGNAFSGTAWLNNQPDGLVYAGKVAYKYKGTMPSNTSIVLKEGTLGIADYAFYDCSGLTSISIPNSVTSIGSDAFSGCSGLTSINIPNSVTSIGNSAFKGCSGLTSINIPNSVTSIGSDAFYGCSGLTTVNIPNSVITIGRQAFYKCSSLTSIDIPNSVTSIGSSAFFNCRGLTSINIPNSVTSIGSSAFNGCTNLQDLYCYAKTLPNDTEFDHLSGIVAIFLTSFANATLHVPASALEDYRTMAPWSGFGTIVPIEEEPTDDLQDYLDSFADTEDVLTETTYTRTFKNTQWQALYVPFSLSYSQWSTLFEVARLTGATTEGDNTQIEATLLTADDGELLANTPYLIRAKNTGRYTLNVDASKMADKTETTKVLDQLIAIKGSYSPRTSLRTNGYRCMLGGSLWYPNDSYTLPPYRWYAYPVRLRIVRNSPITIAIDGNVTSITPATASNGRQEAAPEIYDLYGRRLKDVGTLPTGVYIVNGKKTVIYQR